jgi:hypothetical protein
MFPACRTNLFYHSRLCQAPPVLERADLVQLLFCRLLLP